MWVRIVSIAFTVPEQCLEGTHGLKNTSKKLVVYCLCAFLHVVDCAFWNEWSKCSSLGLSEWSLRLMILLALSSPWPVRGCREWRDGIFIISVISPLSRGYEKLDRGANLILRQWNYASPSLPQSLLLTLRAPLFPFYPGPLTLSDLHTLSPSLTVSCLSNPCPLSSATCLCTSPFHTLSRCCLTTCSLILSFIPQASLSAAVELTHVGLVGWIMPINLACLDQTQ